MISEVPNRPGVKCDACHQVPPTFFSASCPSACGFVLLACGRCASRAAVEQGIEEHGKTCPGFGAVADLQSAIRGIRNASAQKTPAESLLRQGARLGAQMGHARRGDRGRKIGAVAGAAVGAFGDHVLGLPEMGPAVKAARSLAGVVNAVREIIKDEKK